MMEGVVVAMPNGVKAEVAPAAATADSPKSVLEDEVIFWAADLCILRAEAFQTFLPFGLNAVANTMFFCVKSENF